MAHPLFKHVIPLFEGHSLPVTVPVTASQTITTGEQVWICDATGGNVTLTLPPTQQTRGHAIYFVKMQVANQVIIQRAGADVITYAAATSITLNTRDQAALLISDGNGTWIRVV